MCLPFMVTRSWVSTSWGLSGALYIRLRVVWFLARPIVTGEYIANSLFNRVGVVLRVTSTSAPSDGINLGVEFGITPQRDTIWR